MSAEQAIPQCSSSRAANPEGCIAAERAALSAGNGFGVVGARSQQIHP